MTDYAEYIENNLINGPWVLGDNYSICDPYLALVTRWFCDDGVDLDPFQKIKDHNIKFHKRANVKRVMELHK